MEGLDTEELTEAIEMLRKAFYADKRFKLSYTAGISLILWDRYGMNDYCERHRAAEDIIKFILHYDMTVVFGKNHKSKE